MAQHMNVVEYKRIILLSWFARVLVILAKRIGLLAIYYIVYAEFAVSQREKLCIYRYTFRNRNWEATKAPSIIVNMVYATTVQIK